MRVERFQDRRARAVTRSAAAVRPSDASLDRARLALWLLLAVGLALLARPTLAEEAGSKGGAKVSGSVTTRATAEVGRSPQLTTRLGLEWLAGRWSGGFSLNLGNDSSRRSVLARDGVGALHVPERWAAWKSGGPHAVELRLGTARGVTFGQGLVLGSPTFDGIELFADLTPRQRIVALAGRTESLDPNDLVRDDLSLFPRDDKLGNDGELVGLRHETRAGQGLVGVNLLRASASASGVSARALGSADWSFTKGMVDFASEVAVVGDAGYGAYVRASVTPSESWGVTVEGRRYSDFLSPLDSAPRYQGLSASDPQDETGGLVRLDFSPAQRFSGSVSFDYSQGGDPGVTKAGVRRDARATLRWAVSDSTSLTYGFELEDLPSGHDGTVHSMLLSQSFRKNGRLSARLSIDRASSDRRDALRVSWRRPIKGKKLTLLIDQTMRREKTTTQELQAGFSLRMGSASFLTCRATVKDGGPESIDVTWYRRF